MTRSSTSTRNMRIGKTAAAGIAVGAIILALGGGALWYVLARGDDEPQGHTDRITLVAPAVSGRLYASEPELLTSLVMTGGRPQDVAFEISLMAADGSFLPMDGSYRVSAEITNLNDGSHVATLPLEAVADALTPTWRVSDVGVDTEGWWRIRTVTERPAGDPVHAEFSLLMPDPNMAGFTAPPAPDTEPEAAAMLETSLENMGQWDSLRWWEWLSGGDGSIILIEFSVTTPDANGQPGAFQNRSFFAGRMVPDAEGNPPGGAPDGSLYGGDDWGRGVAGPGWRHPGTATGDAVPADPAISGNVRGRD